VRHFPREFANSMVNTASADPGSLPHTQRKILQNQIKIIFPVPVNIISYPYSLRVKETIQRVINANICLFFIGKHLTVTGMDQQATHKNRYMYMNKYRSGSGSQTDANWPKCQAKTEQISTYKEESMRRRTRQFFTNFFRSRFRIAEFRTFRLPATLDIYYEVRYITQKRCSSAPSTRRMHTIFPGIQIRGFKQIFKTRKGL